MTALLSTFGLPNEVNLDPTQGLTAVPGLTNRYVLDSGPEGVLLCKITNLSEAFACGGLFLYDTVVNQQGKHDWKFWVGEMLLTALREGYLNSGIGPGAGSDGSLYTFKRVTQWDGGNIDQYGRAIIPWGGVYDMFLRKVDGYFNNLSTIGVMGVVTLADTGYGSSKPTARPFGDFDGAMGGTAPSLAMSFMANYIPFPKGMSDFLTRVKSFAISRVSDDLRQYYVDTFDSTLAAWDKKNVVPTVSLPTFWANGALTSGAQQKPKDLSFPVNSWPAWGPSHAHNLAEFQAQTWNTGMVSMYDPPAPKYSAAILSSAPRGLKYQMRYRCGHWDAQGLAMPLMDVYTDYCDSVPFTAPTGKVGTLDVGTIRDGHVLHRSQVDNMKYAEDAASHADLGALFTQYIDPHVLPGVDFSTSPYGAPAPTSTTADQAALDTTATGLANFAMRRTIYQMGSLPSLLEEFNDLWDSAAKTAAGV